jgi:hypothetical protein
VLAWTMLLLLAPGALWLWTRCRTLATRAGSRGAPAAKRPRDPQREQAQRSAPAEVLPVLAVERRRIPPRVLRGRVTLAALRPAATLTLPAHELRFAPEAETVAEKPAAQHCRTSYRRQAE